MAKDIHKIIRQIQDLLNQNDMTDIKQFQHLANEYGEFCQFYLENCQKVQNLLDRKMYIEARALAESFKPTLLDQFAVMQFPGLNVFMQILSLYNLTLPPKIDSTTLDQLQAASQQNATYQPLLDEYRKIARSPNLEAKILILRKLVPLVPDNQVEWQKTLLKLESEQLDNLTQQAQKAIEVEDYSYLAELHVKFLNPEWHVKPRPEVLAKIERELGSEYLRQQAVLAEEQLAEINRLYSLGTEHAQLGKVLREWDEFRNTTTWVIPEEMHSQVNSAWQFWQNANDALEKEQAFQRGIIDLGNAIDHNADLEKTDKIYFTLAHSGHDIPEVIRHRYEAYRAAKVAIQKRRRLLGYIITTCVCMLLVVAAVVLFNYLSDRHLVNSYRSRLDIALQESVMDQALAIKEEIERKHAKIIQHPVIHTLLVKLAEQKKTEDEYRATFVGLARQVREGIPFYSERLKEVRNNLAAAEKTLVGQDQQQEYQALSAEVQAAHENYLREQEKRFVALYEKLLQEYQQFKLSLQSNDDSAIRLAMVEVRNLLTQAQKMPDVSASLRSNYEYQDKLFENMTNELEEHNNNYLFLQQCQEMTKIIQDELPETEIKNDGKQIQALLQRLDEIETDLKAKIDTVSDSSKEIWEKLKPNLKVARQAGQRLEGKKQLYETEYQKIWETSGFHSMERMISEYLQKYPLSPHVEELSLFQKRQIAHFASFSQEQFHNRLKLQLKAINNEQARIRQRVQLTLDKLEKAYQQTPLKILAFGSLEFYFSEPVNIRRHAEIMYLTGEISKRLVVKLETLQRASKEYEIEFAGRKVTAAVTYPPFFEGIPRDFMFAAPHQQMVLDLREKLAKMDDSPFWAGDFMKLCIELINPATVFYNRQDFYQRAVVLQEILNAYFQQNAKDQPEIALPQETSLNRLHEKLRSQIQELPQEFQKNWFAASHHYEDVYKKFQDDVGNLYQPIFLLTVEGTMRETELMLASKYTPIGVIRNNDQEKIELSLFLDTKKRNDYPLWVLDEKAEDFIHVANLSASGWSRTRNPTGQDYLLPEQLPVIVYGLTK